MLSPRRRAVAVDSALGALAVAFATLVGAVPRSVAGVVLVGTGTATIAFALFVAEHTDVLEFVNRTRPMSLVLAGVAFSAVGVALVAGRGVVASPSASLLLGMGLGLAGYRAWFGLYRPLPEKRREQAKVWGTPPERGTEDSRR